MPCKTALEYLTVDELAAQCRVTSPTIARWVASGRLPRPIRLGRRWLFPAADVAAHLDRLKDQNKPAPPKVGEAFFAPL